MAQDSLEAGEKRFIAEDFGFRPLRGPKEAINERAQYP